MFKWTLNSRMPFSKIMASQKIIKWIDLEIKVSNFIGFTLNILEMVNLSWILKLDFKPVLVLLHPGVITPELRSFLRVAWWAFLKKSRIWIYIIW